MIMKEIGKNLMELGAKLMSSMYILNIMKAKQNADSLADELEKNGFDVER